MADVDLSVEVRAVGITAAIAQIEQLKWQGLDTGAVMQLLGDRFTRAATASQRAAQAQRGTTDAMHNSAAATQTLTNALRSQEEEYQRLAALSPKLTAFQRLSQNLGTGGITGGIRTATQLQAFRESLSADPVRDLIKVQGQLAEVENARSARLQSQAALQRANWEAGLQGMNRQQEAQARLLRAQQEYTAALAAQRSAPRVTAAARRDPEEEARRLRAQAAAIDAVTAARQRLTAAEAGVASANEARLQASYGYFILAGLATQASQSIYGVAEASLSASMQIERSFADVERTFDGTNSQLKGLRETLLGLSTSTPNSVIDLQQIATLGNQLGIAAEDIQGFTSVIAEYTAVSGQSAEDSATAFGRISNLTGLAASQYRNLASAITYTARTTVATEATIQNTSKEISALAAGAGFSAQAIVGLAGALSSLAIPPERARGALSLYFGALNSAVAEGGPKLQAFAELTNMSAEALNQMVRENRGQEVFTAFVKGLSQLDTVAKTSALDTLGLSTIRVDQTMRALAQNVPLVTQSFEGANTAFQQGTEIGNQYAIIQDTLNSKWIEFQNAAQNAAGAIGDEFAPAAKEALAILTDLLVMARQFADSPLGAVFIKFAGYASLFIGALAAGLGVFALARASLVVLSYSVAQLGWTSATRGLAGWLAALVSTNAATRAAAFSTVGFGVAMRETAAYTAISNASLAGFVTTAKAATLAIGRFALVAAGIIAISAVLGDIERQANRTKYAIEGLGDDTDSLAEAMRTDNMRLFTENMATTEETANAATGGVSDLNAAVSAAAETQLAAQGAVEGTNDALRRQDLRLGDATKAWLNAAVIQSDALQKMLKGEKSDIPIIGGLFDTRPMTQELLAALNAGLDLTAISQTAYTKGSEAALALYDGWEQELTQKAADGDKAAQAAIEAMGGVDFRNVLITPLTEGIDAAASEALVALQLTGTAVTAVAADFDSAGNYVGEFNGTVGETLVTFNGLTDRVSDFRDAIQGAIQGTVSFDSVMQRAKDAADALAEAQGTEVQAVTVTGFGDALQASITDATQFYNDITALAASGNSSFALQLAELGPEAQGILSQALALDPTSQASIEANARFAAFIASDAFKNALEAEMSDSNQAYARIFQTTGNLADVQSYIAAQVAGTGDEWERQWAVNHPNLPLNVTPDLVNPTDEDIALWSQINSGRIKVTVVPTFRNDNDPRQSGTANMYTDTLTGKSITLPANLDGKALTASLSAWQSSTGPTELESQLNTTGLNADIDNWVRLHGPIRMSVSISSITGVPTTTGKQPLKQQGGLITKQDYAGAYMGGGLVVGPGTNTSDSIWARVSMGERIFAADRERFWGRDFMESLDRKMLPASIVSMIAAAAVSGNRGPTTNVNVNLINPTSRDPLKQLREKSEMVAAGLWSNGEDD